MKSPQQIHREGMEEFDKKFTNQDDGTYSIGLDERYAEKEDFNSFLTTLTINQLKGIEEYAKGMKRPMVSGGFEGEREMNIEIATYNEALTDLITHIQENINSIENK